MSKVVYKDFSQKVKRDTKNLLRRGLDVVAQDIVDNLREIVGETEGGGRTYKIYRYGLGGREHTASRPGDPPVRLTGALYHSIGYNFISTYGAMSVACKIGVMTQDTTQSDLTEGAMQRSALSSEFRPYRGDHPANLPYWLEFGTPRMAARPFLGPTMRETMRKGSLYRSKIRAIVTEWSLGAGNIL